MHVPKHKFDEEALEGATKADVIHHQRELLEWLQDINWPVSRPVAKLLKPYAKEIEGSLLEILNRNDEEWQVNILRCFGNAQNPDTLPSIIAFMEKVIANRENESEYIVETCEDMLSI